MFTKIILGIALMVFAQASPIITIDHVEAQVLKTKTADLQADELSLARDIADQLYAALKPYFPAAGLAAPQIGISKSVFIFSYDRDPAHLEVVINPKLEPIGENVVEGWESCISGIMQNGAWLCAKIARYEKIKVSYMNLAGQTVEKVLEGFAAKVFQHEFDHLQGFVNVHREPLEVKTFASKEDYLAFMRAVKEQDAARYRKPE